ncbi:MAG: DUF397 domain-containing protein [Streptosporangiaceae bacterium]|nr:DUF397 domain-containing protein [Streptosporangiaceae bacterium]
MSDTLTWRKSSYSGASGGNCVQVATPPGAIALRDSNHPTGPVLHFTPNEWQAFLASIRA